MGITVESGVHITDEVKEMVELYGHMLTSMRRVKDLRDGSETMAAKDEEVRFHKLEAKVNAAFAKLPRDQQVIIVDELVIKKLMPQEYADILNVFKGRISKC